jgi:hypothetical protein
MLGDEAGVIVGYVMKTLVIAFGITMALLILRSMNKNKLGKKNSDEPGGPEKKV